MDITQIFVTHVVFFFAFEKVFTVWDGKTLLEGSPTRVIQHVDIG